MQHIRAFFDQIFRGLTFGGAGRSAGKRVTVKIMAFTDIHSKPHTYAHTYQRIGKRIGNSTA